MIAGQTAIANQAAVHHLVDRQRALARRYGANGTFALILRVINPGSYGPDMVEQTADVTRAAQARSRRRRPRSDGEHRCGEGHERPAAASAPVDRHTTDRAYRCHLRFSRSVPGR